MTTLDDKLLGEKLHYYCSSSDDDDDGDDDRGQQRGSMPNSSRYSNVRQGQSTNTGPKGVIQDWKRYTKLQAERREVQDLEKLQMIDKLSLKCKSHLDEEAERRAAEQLREELDIPDDLEDEFMKEYMRKRMQEMMDKVGTTTRKAKVFGKLIKLKTGTDFLEAVDAEDKSVTVIVHIYTHDVESCETMNGCLTCLAQQYSQVKFCTFEANSAGMSSRFEKSGVPALLAYKGGNLVGNFVRLADEFGDDFYAVDIDNFLVDHGILPDLRCVPEIITP